MARAKGGRIWRSGAAQGLRQGPRRCYPNLVRVGGWVLGLCVAAALGGIREAGAQSMSLTAKTIYHAYQINLWPGQDLGYRDLWGLHLEGRRGAFAVIPVGPLTRRAVDAGGHAMRSGGKSASARAIRNASNDEHKDLADFIARRRAELP